MDKQKKQTIVIAGVEYNFKPCMKAMIIFETLADKPFELRKMTDIVTYIYSILVACNEGFGMDWNDFLASLDEPGLLEQLKERLGGKTAVETIVAMSNEGGEATKKD